VVYPPVSSVVNAREISTTYSVTPHIGYRIFTFIEMSHTKVYQLKSTDIQRRSSNVAYAYRMYVMSG